MRLVGFIIRTLSPLNLFAILFNNILQYKTGTQKWFYPIRFTNKNFVFLIQRAVQECNEGCHQIDYKEKGHEASGWLQLAYNGV